MQIERLHARIDIRLNYRRLKNTNVDELCSFGLHQRVYLVTPEDGRPGKHNEHFTREQTHQTSSSNISLTIASAIPTKTTKVLNSVPLGAEDILLLWRRYVYFVLGDLNCSEIHVAIFISEFSMENVKWGNEYEEIAGNGWGSDARRRRSCEYGIFGWC